MIHSLSSLGEGGTSSASSLKTGKKEEALPMPEEYDVSLLDYSFINKATRKDVETLLSLLAVLRSGKEGYYPDLERAFEEKILSLDPTSSSKFQTAEKPNVSMSELSAAQADVAAWCQEIGVMDAELRSNAGKKPLRKSDSAISIRGSPSPTSASKPSVSLKIQEESELDVVGESALPPRSILKSARARKTSSGSSASNHETSDENDGDSTVKHVRFQDEVEAAQKERERQKKKQEKRQRQIESHLAHPCGSSSSGTSKKSSSSKRKKHSKKKSSEKQSASEAELSTEAETCTDSSDDQETYRKTDGVVPALPVLSNVRSGNRIKSSDYRAWDKFNVDEELAKIDKEENSGTNETRVTPPSVVGSTVVPVLKEDINSLSDSAAAILRLADAEKIKGNDAYRAGDYAEAVTFYTRSIHIKPQPAVYNNRALVYLKLKDYPNAELDATTALKYGDKESEFKSYLRRASALFSRGKYVESLQDLDCADSILKSKGPGAPGKSEVDGLRKNIEAKTGGSLLHQDTKTKDNEGGEEIEEIVTPLGTSVTSIQHASLAEVEKGGRRSIQIVDVESDSDSDEEQFVLAAQPESFQHEADAVSLVVDRKEEPPEPKLTLVKESTPELNSDYPVPTTSFEFESAFKSLSLNRLRWNEYVMSIPPEKFPRILENVASDSLLKHIFDTLGETVKAHPDRVFGILCEIRTMSRWKLLRKFLSKAEKRGLENVFKHLQTVVCGQDVENLRKDYV